MFMRYRSVCCYWFSVNLGVVFVGSVAAPQPPRARWRADPRLLRGSLPCHKINQPELITTARPNVMTAIAHQRFQPTPGLAVDKKS